MVTDEDVKKAETLKAELQKVIDYFNEGEEETGNISDGVRTTSDERDDVDEIVKTLQDYFGDDKQ